MCQRVTAAIVPRFVIQPVPLFGRPGSLTCNHRIPFAAVLWPRTGSTVCSSVIGRRAPTICNVAELAFGADIAGCGPTSSARSWLGDSTSGLLLDAGAVAPAHAPTSVRAKAREAGSFV